MKFVEAGDAIVNLAEVTNAVWDRWHTAGEKNGQLRDKPILRLHLTSGRVLTFSGKDAERLHHNMTFRWRTPQPPVPSNGDGTQDSYVDGVNYAAILADGDGTNVPQAAHAACGDGEQD